MRHGFSIILGFVSIWMLFIQCNRETDKDTKKDSDFKASLKVPFRQAPQQVSIRFRNNAQLKNLVNGTLLPAIEKQALKAYRSDSFKKRFPADSLDKAGIKYNYFQFFTNWQLHPKEPYGYLNVKGMAYPSGLENQLLYLRPSAVIQSLDSGQLAVVRRYYYTSMIEQPLRNDKAQTLVPAYQVGKWETVRYVTSELNQKTSQSIFIDYVQRRMQPVDERLLQAVRSDSLQAYQSPSLEATLSDKALNQVLKKDSNIMVYRPSPIKKPNYSRDTLLVKPLKADRIQGYVILEKWQPLPGSFLDYRPAIQGVAPVVSYPSGKKALYWLKGHKMEKILNEEQQQWLRAYWLHLLQAKFLV